MSSVKDPFEILADEITLIRRQLDQLQRTSLNRDEAEALNKKLVQGVEQMGQTGQAIYDAIFDRMSLGLEKLRLETLIAAREAASGAIGKSHAESIAAARQLSKAAGEARREAWRYFGGFWVWLASVGAGGAVLGLLAMFWLQGRADAEAFGQHPRIYCVPAGGQIQEQSDGSSFCAVWITRPSQVGG